MRMTRLCLYKNNTLITQRALRWAGKLQEWIIKSSVLTTLGVWSFKYLGTYYVGMCFGRHLVGVESPTWWQYSLLSVFIPLKNTCHFDFFTCSLNFSITSTRHFRKLPPGSWAPSWCYNTAGTKTCYEKRSKAQTSYINIYDTYNYVPLWFSHCLQVFFCAGHADKSILAKPVICKVHCSQHLQGAHAFNRTYIYG